MKKDFLTRLTELAGEMVAAHIVAEYGGEAVYIRKTLDHEQRVLCGVCAYLKNNATCAHPECVDSGLRVSPSHFRFCPYFKSI